MTGRSVPNRFEDEYGAPLPEFAPVQHLPSHTSAADLTRATDSDWRELDLYESRQRAWEDAEERRYAVSGMDSGEEQDTYGVWGR